MECLGKLTLRLEYNLNSIFFQCYAVLQSEPTLMRVCLPLMQHWKRKWYFSNSRVVGISPTVVEQSIVYPRSTAAERSKIKMMRHWKLVFPLRNNLSWHFRPEVLVFVLLSRITLSMRLTIRSMVRPKELLKRMASCMGRNQSNQLHHCTNAVRNQTSA